MSVAAWPYRLDAPSTPELIDLTVNHLYCSLPISYAVGYLIATGDQAVELCFVGSPPARPHYISLRSDGKQELSEIYGTAARLTIPYGEGQIVVMLGPRLDFEARRQLREIEEGVLVAIARTELRTKSMALEFQARRAERIRRRESRLAAKLGGMTSALRQVAHDLKNHLTTVNFAVEDLQDRLTDPEHRHLASHIERQSALVERMLRGTLERLFTEAPPSVVELGLLMSDVAQGWALACERKGCSFSWIVAEESLLVQASAAQITQILGNLLCNALKFTPTGGRIVLRVLREGGYAVIEVEDNGIGISDPDQALLGTREYLQIDGYGIGLSSVRSALDELAGELRIVRLPQGSLFRVRLPLLD